MGRRFGPFRRWLVCFLGSLPFLALSFVLTVLYINNMYCVAAKREQFCGSFEMLGTDILLALGIRPL